MVKDQRRGKQSFSGHAVTLTSFANTASLMLSHQEQARLKLSESTSNYSRGLGSLSQALSSRKTLSQKYALSCSFLIPQCFPLAPFGVPSNAVLLLYSNQGAVSDPKLDIYV